MSREVTQSLLPSHSYIALCCGRFVPKGQVEHECDPIPSYRPKLRHYSKEYRERSATLPRFPCGHARSNSKASDCGKCPPVPTEELLTPPAIVSVTFSNNDGLWELRYVF